MVFNGKVQRGAAESSIPDRPAVLVWISKDYNSKVMSSVKKRRLTHQLIEN